MENGIEARIRFRIKIKEKMNKVKIEKLLLLIRVLLTKLIKRLQQKL